MALPPPVPKAPDNVNQPFNPNAIYTAENPSASINFGINLDEAGFPTHPQDINPCGLLIRLDECSEQGLGSSTVTQQRTVNVTAGTTATPNRVQLAAVNATRRFVLVRNIGGFPIWFGNADVLPGDVPQANGGTLLLPGEYFAITAAEDRHQDAIFAIGYGGQTLVSVLEY